MGFFDQAYDDMELEQISCRLPGDLATKALIRRITNLDTLLMFFASCSTKPREVKELRSHVNTVLNGYAASDILTKFEEKYHSVLFDWTDDANRARLRTDGKALITVKQAFNMTDAKDAQGLSDLLDKILAETEVKASYVSSVLNKSDLKVFPQLVGKVIKDNRNEVRCCVLCTGDRTKQSTIGDNIRLVALKAWAKTDIKMACDTLDFKLLSTLRPAERLEILRRYLGQFPLYRKCQVFISEPSEEEFDLMLFAGCLDQNDLVVELKSLYRKITKEDKPVEEK